MLGDRCQSVDRGPVGRVAAAGDRPPAEQEVLHRAGRAQASQVVGKRKRAHACGPVGKRGCVCRKPAQRRLELGPLAARHREAMSDLLVGAPAPDGRKVLAYLAAGTLQLPADALMLGHKPRASVFDLRSVLAERPRPGPSPEPIASLDDFHLEAEIVQRDGGRQPGEPGPHDDDRGLTHPQAQPGRASAFAGSRPASTAATASPASLYGAVAACGENHAAWGLISVRGQRSSG